MPSKTGTAKGTGKNQLRARNIVRELGMEATDTDTPGKRFIAKQVLEDRLRDVFKERQVRWRMKHWLEKSSGLLTPTVGGYFVDAKNI